MKRCHDLRWPACLAVVLAAIAVWAPAASAAENDEGWISLFNGKDLTGWKVTVDSYQVEKVVDAAGNPVRGARIVRIDGRQAVVGADKKEIKDVKVVSETFKNPTGGWTVKDGVLISASGPDRKSNIMTERKFRDLELHIEFLASANSGVYLNGLYEIQIDNSFGVKPQVKEVGGRQIEVPFRKDICGSIYSATAPAKNLCKPPTEWQTYDVTFRAARTEGKKVKEKARITLVWNGEKAIDNFELSEPTGGGPTGSNLGISQGDAGPLMLQGDHGRVSFRNIKIKPLTGEK
jgi:hypothetical protein